MAYQLLAKEKYNESIFEAARNVRCYYCIVESKHVVEMLGKNDAITLAFQYALKSSKLFEKIQYKIRSATMFCEAAQIIFAHHELFNPERIDQMIIGLNKFKNIKEIINDEYTKTSIDKNIINLKNLKK